MTSYFPDVNVWLALTLDTHDHFSVATAWLESLSLPLELVFCRFTQLSLLRLLTQRSVAGPATLSQRQAWVAYDRWLKRGGAVFMDEPLGLEVEFRALANQGQPAPRRLCRFLSCRVRQLSFIGTGDLRQGAEQACATVRSTASDQAVLRAVQALAAGTASCSVWASVIGAWAASWFFGARRLM